MEHDEEFMDLDSEQADRGLCVFVHRIALRGTTQLSVNSHRLILQSSKSLDHPCCEYVSVHLILSVRPRQSLAVYGPG